MEHRTGAGHRRLVALVAGMGLFVVGLVLIGAALTGQLTASPPARVPDVAADAAAAPSSRPSLPLPRSTPPTTQRGDLAGTRAPVSRDPVAEPIRVRVPSIDVAATVRPLGLDAEGVLEVPEDPEQVGWFSLGTAPGDVGAAVIAGHVDSRDGPAVFFELADVPEGAEIIIDRDDGTTATFRVERVVHHPKDELPIAEVYASTGPELRLITCGGEWDRESSSYRDNIIAYATLVDSAG